jgi:V8-like Glu-specific endopeptidase
MQLALHIPISVHQSKKNAISQIWDKLGTSTLGTSTLIGANLAVIAPLCFDVHRISGEKR